MTTRKNVWFSSKHLSDEELLELLRKKAEELGHAPTADHLKKNPTMPESTVYIERFGSWNNALKAAGLKSRYCRCKDLSDEEMLDLLREKVNKIGYIPTKNSLTGDIDIPNPASYAKRFGSWTRALNLAGFETTLSDETLITLLQNKVIELGYIPSIEMVEEDYTMPSVVTYRKHFGTWGNSLKAAGFEPVK
ncbi:hypothetical protein IKW75_01140 [Candidatus Saccharibacteria bacterium]|nr:hypothetical protein [Candidatus Saccharibacteria bacterium]